MVKQTFCRACNAPIIFIKTKAGKSIPCDAESVTFLPNGDDLFVLPDGTTMRGKAMNVEGPAAKIGYTSHFATCTNPDFFRKPRKSDRKKG